MGSICPASSNPGDSPHQVADWRHTEYHRPRFCSRHFGSAQSRFSTCSGGVLLAAGGGLSSCEHAAIPATDAAIATAASAALTRTPCPVRRRLPALALSSAILPSTLP